MSVSGCVSEWVRVCVCVPVEGVCFCDGSVEATSCSAADKFKKQHHTVARLLGDGEIHTLA